MKLHISRYELFTNYAYYEQPIIIEKWRVSQWVWQEGGDWGWKEIVAQVLYHSQYAHVYAILGQ